MTLTMTKTVQKHPDSKLIDELGGTAVVARECNLSMSSVSDWRRTGMPESRRMYLELKFPAVFHAATKEAADA